MNSYTAFKIVKSVHLHFTSMGYSMIKYGTNSSTIANMYAKTTPNKRYRYEWLADKLTTPQNVLYASIACVFADISPQFDDKELVMDAYLKFKGRREAIGHTLLDDAKKHEFLNSDFTFDQIFVKFVGGFYSPEYVILLDEKENRLQSMYEDKNFAWAHSNILKLIKYKDFFNSKKYLHILEQ